MSFDPLSAENKSSAPVSYNPLYLQEGKTILALPIPDELLRLIGLVAVYWGAFEVELDKVITMLYEALQIDGPPGWQHSSFAKRKKLLVEITRNPRVEGKAPEVASGYRKVAGDAADLHWRRNVVLHGQYRITFPPAGSNYPVYWAESKRNGSDVRVEIDEPTLGKLWHGIAHLSGALITTARLHSSRDGWPWTLSDTDLLQMSRDGNLHFLPIPDTD